MSHFEKLVKSSTPPLPTPISWNQPPSTHHSSCQSECLLLDHPRGLWYDVKAAKTGKQAHTHKNEFGLAWGVPNAGLSLVKLGSVTVRTRANPSHEKSAFCATRVESPWVKCPPLLLSFKKFWILQCSHVWNPGYNSGHSCLKKINTHLYSMFWTTSHVLSCYNRYNNPIRQVLYCDPYRELLLRKRGLPSEFISKGESWTRKTLIHSTIS